MRDLAGTKFVELANQYVNAFPIGRTFPVKEFDNWGIEIGVLPDVKDRKSLEWEGLLKGRHTLKTNINRGGMCLMLPPEGRFQITIIKNNVWKTDSITQAAIKGSKELVYKISTVLDTKATGVTRLINSTEFSSLSVESRSLLRGLKRELGYAQKSFNDQINLLDTRMKDVFSEIEAEVLMLEANGVDVRETKALLRLTNTPQPALPLFDYDVDGTNGKDVKTTILSPSDRAPSDQGRDADKGPIL